MISLMKRLILNLSISKYKNGTNGLVPAGTTGESPTLSHDEHQKVIELCASMKAKEELYCNSWYWLEFNERGYFI